MNALAKLKQRTRLAANPANPANPTLAKAPDSQDSQDSQRGECERLFLTAPSAADDRPLPPPDKGERTRLLELAAAEWIDAAHVHRMTDADLADWIAAGLDDGQRRAFLHLLDDTASRQAGRVPLDDTTAMVCAGCGPVWIHPGIAAVLPVVDGWPRGLGCPWCAVRKAGGYIPRPPVTCEGCRHFTPDTSNPEAGMGNCNEGNGIYWAAQKHACAAFHPSKEPTT